MAQDRDRERETRQVETDPIESVGPARPIHEREADGGGSEPPLGPNGERVGKAQPIDPARRRPPDEAAPARPAPDLPVPDTDDLSVPDTDDRAHPAERPPARQASRPGARRGRTTGARGALDRVRRTEFPVVLRGYDRAAVDSYVADVAQLVAELEATQLPESVVQRALDDVGEETSAILKRAHEAAEEITRRSRSQAEDRLQRAEREADLTRKEAEEQVQRLEEDARTIWQERQRLIDDIRTLADEVLGVADDAIDRLPPPGGEAAPEEASVGDGEEGAWLDPDEEDSSGHGRETSAGAADEPFGAEEGFAGPGGSGSGEGPEGEDGADSSDDAALTLERRPEDEDTAERPPR